MLNYIRKCINKIDKINYAKNYKLINNNIHYMVIHILHSTVCAAVYLLVSTLDRGPMIRGMETNSEDTQAVCERVVLK